MAIFRYEAADAGGVIRRGAMDAATAEEVARRLETHGFRQVRVHGANVAGQPSVSRSTVRDASASSSSPDSAPAVPGGIPRPEDTALFFRQMGSLVHAGFTVSAALADLAPRTAHKGLGRAAGEMAQATAQGSSLAAQMARFPTLFAPHVTGLVQAGETGGFVEFAFEEAALGAEQDAALRQGMWWAKLLAWQSVWSVLLTLPMISSVDAKNPMNTGHNYLHALLFFVIPCGIALHIASYALGKMRHQPAARDTFDALSLKLPVMAHLAKMRALAAFTRVLRRLLMAGISPEPAFSGAVNAVPNAVLRERLRIGVPVVRAGRGLDEAISATGLMEHDPVQMLVTGQKTGQWIEMLDRVTAYYQEEAARATDKAKAAQKQVGVILTLLSSGYVMIVAAQGMSHMFGWVEQFMGTNE